MWSSLQRMLWLSWRLPSQPRSRATRSGLPRAGSPLSTWSCLRPLCKAGTFLPGPLFLFFPALVMHVYPLVTRQYSLFTREADQSQVSLFLPLSFQPTLHSTAQTVDTLGMWKSWYSIRAVSVRQSVGCCRCHLGRRFSQAYTL